MRIIMAVSEDYKKMEQETIDKINKMSHYDMCVLWRTTISGHPYFDRTKPFYEIFRARLFDHFGGFTPEISKSIGW